MDIWLIFLTGLTVGGLTCLAVQGGLLTSVISTREKELRNNSRKHAAYSVGAFLIAKLLAYTTLGFILGAFGSAVSISSTAQVYMQLLAGIYMLAVALNLLNVHPIFRYAVIQPPRFLTRLVRNQSKSKDIFAPALLGVMTIFIPCGTTLAMEALAVSSSDPIKGASILAAFTLGTIPLFFGIGFITSILGDSLKTRFLKIAAAILIFLGISAVNGSLVALGSPLTLQSFSGIFSNTENRTVKSNSKVSNTVEITVSSRGYSPDYIRVKKGEPVTLKLISRDAYTCASAFRIPSQGISENLRPNETKIVTFTPEKEGIIPFSCSMGMYTGTIEVL